MTTREAGLPGVKPRFHPAKHARRRIVDALVRPGTQIPDREVPRTLWCVAGSAGAAAVVFGVVAAVGAFQSGAPSGWRSDLINDRQGTRYVVLAGRLHPVLNLTSAKLILGKDLKKADVPDSALAPLKASMGPGVGIAGAPESLPSPGSLDVKTWSLCTATSTESALAGKTVLELGYPASPSGVLTNASSVLVQDETGTQYVIDGATKYKVEDRNVLVAFNAPNLKPRRTKSTWLSGLPTGDPLGVPALSGTFGDEPNRPAPTGFDKVGMFGKTAATSDGTAAYYLVSGDGLAPVSLTTYELYQRDPRLAAAKFTETELDQSRITQDMIAASSPGMAWPTDPPEFTATSQDAVSTSLCLAFDGAFDAQNHPALAVSDTPTLPHPLTPTEMSEFTLSGRGVADVVAVAVGHGAIAHDHDSGTGTSSVTYLVTDARTRFALVGGTGDTAASGVTAARQLGYESVAASDVPGAWLRLLPSGPALDPAKASQVQAGVGG